MASRPFIDVEYRSSNGYIATCSPFLSASACEGGSAELFGTFAFLVIL